MNGTPYRSDWRNRLKDLSAAIVVWILLSLLAKLAIGAGNFCRLDPNTGQVVCAPALAIDTRCVQVDDCTAAVVNWGGDTRYVVTSRHGGKNVGERYVVSGPDGSRTFGTVVAVGPNDADCALLRTDQRADRGFQLAAFEPPLGSSVKLLGYSLGGPLRAKQLRPYSYDDARTAEAHGAPVLGDSGGPVLDAFGNLVGILSGQHGGPAFYCRLGPILSMFAAVAASNAAQTPAHTSAETSAPPFIPPKLPPPPTATSEGAQTAEADARGWTSAAAPPAAAPTVVVQSVPYVVRPNPYGPDWHADIDGRVTNAERAIANVEITRRADVAELRTSIDTKAATLAAAIDQAATPPPPAPTVVERIDRTGYLELLAQIALVAGGSVSTLGAGYGAWWLAGKAALSFSRWYLRKRFAAPPPPPATAPAPPAAPPLQRFEFDSVLQQAVPVGAPHSPPVVVHTPPVVTQAPADTRYVTIETDLHARAHAWAAAETARIYGDRPATAAAVQTTQDALIKQYLAGRKI